MLKFFSKQIKTNYSQLLGRFAFYSFFSCSLKCLSITVNSFILLEEKFIILDIFVQACILKRLVQRYIRGSKLNIQFIIIYIPIFIVFFKHIEYFANQI